MTNQTTTESPKRIKIDETDRAILSLLSRDSRMSNVEIAHEIGLTEGAVRRRIDTLFKEGVISRFTIETKLGTNYAVVMLKARGDTKKMMADVMYSGIPVDAYEISGDYDGCIIVDGMDLAEIDEKIDQLRNVQSIVDTKTFLSFRRWTPAQISSSSGNTASTTSIGKEK